MKAIKYLMFIFLFCATCSFAQDYPVSKYFKTKPGDLQAQFSESQEYDVILKWQNLDAITGNMINCNAVKATYITGLEHNYVGWKNVSLAQIDDFNQNKFEGTELPSFNDFTYSALDTSFLSDEFYQIIPAEQRDLAKWLVSDAIQMHGLAWYSFDSLEYNKEFIPGLLENYNVKFEDWVTFTSRYQKLIWSGISHYNDEICAIVKFESLYNPVKIDNDQMSVKGRSLYYGEMWISLADKQVEYATMVEDVIMKITSQLFPDEQLLNLQREIVFDKQK